MISHHQQPFEVCQPVLSTHGTIQIWCWSFNCTVSRDQVCSLMNACLAWFIWHWPEERTYLAFGILPFAQSFFGRLSSRECFLSSFLYLLAALGGKLGCYHWRSRAAKAPCQGTCVRLWWGGEEWLDHAVLQSSSCVAEACHTNAFHAASANGKVCLCKETEQERVCRKTRMVVATDSKNLGCMNSRKQS